MLEQSLVLEEYFCLFVVRDHCPAMIGTLVEVEQKGVEILGPNAARFYERGEFPEQVGAANGMAASCKIEVGGPTIMHRPVLKGGQNGYVGFMCCGTSFRVHKQESIALIACHVPLAV